VSAPSLVFDPLPFTIGGRVFTRNGNVCNALVSVVYGGKVFNTTTDMEGCFRLDLSGFYTGLMGFSILTVNVEPSEPWIEAKTVAVKVFMVNLVVLPLLVVLFLTVLYLIYTRFIPRRRGVEIAPSVAEVSTVTGETPRRLGVPSVSGGVVDAVVAEFTRLLMFVCRVLGVGFGESETLREFASKLKGRVSESVYRVFLQVVLAVERHLYSPLKVRGGEEVERFKRLVRVVWDALSKAR